MAKEAFYFSHDTGARNDPKLQKVLMKLGHAGKSVFWDLVEMLHEEGGYLKIDEIENYAFSIRTTTDIIESLINDFGLFKRDDTLFWSESALNRMSKRNDKSGKAAISASKKWNASETPETRTEGVKNAYHPQGSILNLIPDHSKIRSERLAAARQKGTHTKEQWEEMLSFFRSCVKCGSTEKLVKDHIIPIYQGGSDSILNLQPLCAKCNSSKGPDRTDYRKEYCLRNACEMPANLGEMGAIKEIKEIKERREVTENASPNLSNSNLFRQPNIPKWEEVYRTFMQQGGTEEMAKKFFENNNSVGWFYKGSPVVNYASQIPGYIKNWRANIRNNPIKTNPTYFSMEGRKDLTKTV